MSYRCQITGRQTRPNQPQQKVIAQTRIKTYYRWVKNEDTMEWEKQEMSQGFEPVIELVCSEEGYLLWQSWNKEERANFLANLNDR